MLKNYPTQLAVSPLILFGSYPYLHVGLAALVATAWCVPAQVGSLSPQAQLSQIGEPCNDNRNLKPGQPCLCRGASIPCV